MTITDNVQNDTVTVFISGEIDGTNVGEFESAVKESMDKAPNMIMDLSDLSYVSSAGLRVFLMSKKMSEAAGKTMTICNLTDDVMSIFSVTGFVKLLNIST